MEHGVCIRVLGDLTLLPPGTRKAVAEVVRFSKNNTKYDMGYPTKGWECTKGLAIWFSRILVVAVLLL